MIQNDISLVHEISFIYLKYLFHYWDREKVGAMMRTIEVFNCMKHVVFQLKMLEFVRIGTIKDVCMAI